MYHGVAGTTAAGAATTLPFTGAEPLWLVLGGVAMIALAGAFRRLVPRKEQ